jgi:eukaryotic-like serine/threonine-protein kinase
VIGVGSIVNGKYRIVRSLGDGGMGSVFEAQHAVLGTRVAIKVLHPELMRRTGLVERFLQEARVVAQIHSANVVQVIDVDRTPEGHAFIVMELLEGEALSAVLDRQRRLPVPIACAYAAQILSALEAAHALGVIHRDLKPENVIVTMAAGRPILKLIDFGIAKARRTEASPRNLTVAGVVMGTAEYMAPEQARSAESVDARADLYAVGVMLYEMIAGMRPVRGDAGEDARVVALRVERGEVIPLVQAAPGAPRELAGLVHHAMAARPEMRFASAAQMRVALEGLKDASVPRMSSAPPGGSAPGFVNEPRVDTVRAPPIATALVGPSYSSGYTPVAPASPAIPAAEPYGRRPSTAGRTAAIASLGVLFVASVAGILVGVGVFNPSARRPEVATGEPSSTAQPASVEMAASTPPPSIQGDVPTLVSARPAATGVHPAPSSRAVAPGDRDAAPASSVDPSASAAPPSFNGIPLPAGFPTALPSGFPTALPSGFPMTLPSGLPTALPSGFPTALPGGFPTVLPAWPTAAPTAASSARSSRSTPQPSPTEF